MKTAVITTVHGRSAHLRNQRVGLDRGTSPIDLHVVVAMDDPCAADVVRDGAPPTVLVDCDAGAARCRWRAHVTPEPAWPSTMVPNCSSFWIWTAFPARIW